MILTGLIVAPSWHPALSMITVGLLWQEDSLSEGHMTRFILDDPMGMPRGDIVCHGCGYRPKDTTGMIASLTWELREVVPVHVYQSGVGKWLFQTVPLPENLPGEEA